MGVNNRRKWFARIIQSTPYMIWKIIRLAGRWIVTVKPEIPALKPVVSLVGVFESLHLGNSLVDDCPSFGGELDQPFRSLKVLEFIN